MGVERNNDFGVKTNDIIVLTQFNPIESQNKKNFNFAYRKVRRI
jgi:hypothetical protein